MVKSSRTFYLKSMMWDNLVKGVTILVLSVVLNLFSKIVTGEAPQVDILSESLSPKPTQTPIGDPCKVCRILVKSFEKGIRDTSRGKFDGGDADWEESRLRSYADSEIRLTEIQERLCNEVSQGKDECHHMAEEAEAVIEKWWFKGRKLRQSLFQALCVDDQKVCCPWGHSGPECEPCPSCNNHGKCRDNGTRATGGGCECDTGYSGADCSECASGFFVKTSNPITCETCDRSCLGHCRHGGPKGCEVCRDGYSWDPTYGCLDVDECIDLVNGRNPCDTNSFCINTEGSFYCFQCDKACHGCNGDGPDMCISCADGFALKDGVCTDVREASSEKAFEMSRYATYLGLCIATCIIFKNNVYIASVIGVIVATYIAFAEYSLTNKPLLSPVEQAFRQVVV